MCVKQLRCSGSVLNILGHAARGALFYVKILVTWRN